MTTIFTDEFISTETEIHIDEPEMSYTGRDLVFTSDNCEVRIRLNDNQFKELADQLLMNDYGYVGILEAES